MEVSDFSSFLERFLVNGVLPEVLVIDYKDLESWNGDFAKKIIEDQSSFTIFEESTQAYSGGKGKVPISIKNVPTIVELRDLCSDYIGKIVGLHGIVTRVVPIRPLLTKGVFECKVCQERIEIIQDESFVITPYKCTGKYEGKTKKGKSVMRNCRSRYFRRLDNKCEFTDIQELAIQECPEDLPAGQLPHQIDLQIKRKDLINKIRAGDIVDVVGILRAKSSSPTSQKREFSMFFEVNYIESLNKEISDIKISLEEEQEICSLSKLPNIYDIIINSIAPSIYGNTYIKEAIMYLLFGGTKKDKGDIIVRGEMNALLIGDPSCGKSQLLQAVSSIAPRCVYTSGKGSTAAGLTATVNKVDNVWCLEAGAAVIADKGILCVDEMDKMNDNDRIAIHEVMESHRVSVNKAGINARLNARVAVLAAANPDLGRYDNYKTVVENVRKLPITLLSRFDLIFIVRDKSDSDEDKALSTHILELGKSNKELIDRELLKKYIAYARNLEPTISNEAKQRLQEFYIQMRESGNGNGENSPIIITPRQLESMMRIAEAHAKIVLKNIVDVGDVEAAIDIMMKSLNQVGINPSTQKMDIDLIMTGTPKTERHKLDIVMNILDDYEPRSLSDISEAVKDSGIQKSDVGKLLSVLLRDGMIHCPSEGIYKRV